MSRNLGSTSCYFCYEQPVLVEQRRPITEADCGAYYGEFKGMQVANAECPVCEAKYLAWVDAKALGGFGHLGRDADPEIGFVDLSFRSSFDDEPGPDDMPKWRIVTELTLHRNPWVPKDPERYWCYPRPEKPKPTCVDHHPLEARLRKLAAEWSKDGRRELPTTNVVHELLDVLDGEG